jgi:hypothetical protein
MADPDAGSQPVVVEAHNVETYQVPTQYFAYVLHFFQTKYHA